MTSLRRLALLVSIFLAGGASAQTPAPASDERAARVAERYKAMLLANPAEGLALDRLWKYDEERGATGELIEEFRRLADAPGAGAAPALVYGFLLKRAGRLDEADASDERAAALDPTGPLPPLARAELALARSQPEKAAAFLSDALGKLPAGDRRAPEILLKLGSAWLAAGQPLKAAESWEKMIARDPANTGLRRRVAENYERNGQPERARVHYEYIEAHADPAERAAALRDLARLHESRGDFDAARDALERGLTLTARDNWLHGDLETRLIRLYERAGRVPELESRWRAAAEAAPRDLGGYGRLEALAEAQGDLVGERHWLEKIVALAPRDRDDALKLARRLADDGDRAQAAAWYDGLLRGQPDSLDLVLARADLDLQLGQPAAAVGRVEARVARNPADESVTTPALAFFLDHHLDDAAERCLRAEVARQPAASEPALALAKFLFARRQGAEARTVLAALTARPGDAVTRAARWTQAAETFREQNLGVEALGAWHEAAALLPQAAAPLLAAGEYLLARGDKTAAADEFAHAAARLTGQEQVDVERRLFGALQSADGPGAAGEGPGGVRADQPLGRELAALEKTAAETPTSDHLLRLARWQSWARLLVPAWGSVSRAIEVDPDNLAARELAANLAAELHRPAEAAAQWQALAARDPGHKSGYRRRLANLEMDAGDSDGAVAILAELQQADPGSREALTDLALAQQRADRWSDALVTWERAYALPGETPAQRDEIRRPLLAAYERLGQFLRASELLRAAVDEQTDGSARNDLFHQLAAFCHRHDLGPTLREDYEKRLAARPDDFFLLTAVAELSREDGQEREAYALMQRAFYSSPDPARSLRELADEAEPLGEDAAAVAYQRRLVALPGQATAGNLERLAALEDAGLDEAAATRTWESMVARFPRDTAVLGQAADFFQKADQLDRARDLLRQFVSVDPTDTRRLLSLGTLDVQAGDVAAARAHFEQLLAGTTPEAADEALVLPAELAARAEPAALFGYKRPGSGWRGVRFGRPAAPAAGGSAERGLRLQAIEELSRLLLPKNAPATATPDPAQAAWLQRWRAAAAAGAKSEPLAAFYFSGRSDLTMNLLAPWMERADATGELALDAFLNAGLRLGGYQRLADWAWRGGDAATVAVHGQRLLRALQTYLTAGGRPGPGMVGELFPATLRVQEVLWTAAQSGFAANQWYAQAAELGERVLASASSGVAGYGVEVAGWELYTGNPARARAALRRGIDDAGGDSLENGNPVFLALRSYYELLPGNERAAFVREYLGRRRGGDGPARGILSAVVLHGLSGDETAARRDLDQLLALRLLAVEQPTELSPDARRWAYLLTNGEQLQAWNLNSLAVYLWRQALKEAGSYGQQTGNADNTVTELRRRLLSAEVATAPDPQQARERMQEFVDAPPDPAFLASVAGQLWTDGQRDAAARLYEVLCQTDSANTDYWPNLYTFYESTGDQDAAERLLGLMLAAPRSLPAGVSRAELTCDLAALREKRGDVPAALRGLERARLATPGSLPVLFQLARTYEAANRWDEAASVWRESLPLDPNHTARLGLAGTEEHRGRVAAAVEILRGGLRDGPDPERVELAFRLTELLLKDHRPAEARQLASDLLKQGQLEALPALGAAFKEAGLGNVAREILSAAVLRSPEPAERFHLQQGLIEQMTPGEDPAEFARQMRRLGKLAQALETLRGEYDALLYPLARQQGADAWLENELQRAWKQGQGDPSAGVQLAGLALQAHREEALRQIVQTIAAHPDLPENLLYTLATSLVDTDHAPLALALCDRLVNRFPQKQQYQLERALALWKSDRRPEADQLLANFTESAVFHDETLEPVVAFYREHGATDRAAGCLERIVESDPAAARSPQAWLQLAQLALDGKRVPDAARLLRVAYARPACEDLGPLVRYLGVSGSLEGEKACQMPAPGFPLTFSRRARLLAAVRAELDRTGRAADGQRLVETHAEFLVATPALAAEMCHGATPANVGEVAACLERAAGARGQVPASLAHELAALYTRWAEWDANDPSTRHDALAHLSRAFELEPDDFSVASRLAKLCVQEKQPARASEVLAAFLTPDALATERAQARQILTTP